MDQIDRERLFIRLTGPGVSPETVRASDLGEFIGHFERAILETVLAKEMIAPEVVEQEATVSLVAISAGSEALTFALTGQVLPGASMLSDAVARQDYSAIPMKAHSELHEISKQAIKRSWSVEFVEDEGRGVHEAIISEADPVPAPRVVTAQGETTIYGRLIRVGGVTPTAMIELPNHKYLYISINEMMAVELASKERLYKDVGIEGVAKWRVDTWEMLDFRATKITPYQPHHTNLVRTFEKLAEAASSRWNDVDVQAFVDELRGGPGRDMP